MELDYKAIGKRIKIARIQAELSQEALAEKADLSPTHMSNIENANTKLSLPMLISIANALSVSADTRFAILLSIPRKFSHRKSKAPWRTVMNMKFAS